MRRLSVTSHSVEPSRCPGCGLEPDVATGATEDGKGPEPRDATVCAHCGVLSVFDDDMRLRAPTEEELEEIRAHPMYDVMTRTADHAREKTRRLH